MNSRPTTQPQRTVVVCGATGYLGRHVVRALHDDGWRVFREMAERGRVW